MATDNLTLCYNGIQRTYRNALVTFVRTRFQEAYAEGAGQRLQATFGTDWDTIKAQANDVRARGLVVTTLTDDFDLLGVNHFFNVFDCHFPTLVSVSKGQQPTVGKTALLEWIRVVAKIRNPLSHPPETDFEFVDALLLLDRAHRVLKALQLHEAARALRPLIDQLFGQPRLISTSYSPN